MSQETMCTSISYAVKRGISLNYFRLLILPFDRRRTYESECGTAKW